MKVNSLLFITTFLAAASLGSALPPLPTLPNLPSNATSAPTPPESNLPSGAPSNVTSDAASNATTDATTDAASSPFAAVPSSVLGDLSKQCQSTLLSIVTSPEFLKCIPVSSLVPLLPLVTNPDLLKKFLADPVHNYPPVESPLLQFATLFCPAPKCSDTGVAGAIKAMQDGCKDDLDKKNPLIEFIFTAAVFYSPIKDISCFKFGKTFCWDESILTVISLPPSPFKITGNDLIDSIAVADPTAICTKCNKAIVNDFFNFINDKGNDLARQILTAAGVDQKKLTTAQVGVAVKCGAKFEDGNIPK